MLEREQPLRQEDALRAVLAHNARRRAERARAVGHRRPDRLRRFLAVPLALVFVGFGLAAWAGVFANGGAPSPPAAAAAGSAPSSLALPHGPKLSVPKRRAARPHRVAGAKRTKTVAKPKLAPRHVRRTVRRPVATPTLTTGLPPAAKPAHVTPPASNPVTKTTPKLTTTSVVISTPKSNPNPPSKKEPKPKGIGTLQPSKPSPAPKQTTPTVPAATPTGQIPTSTDPSVVAFTIIAARGPATVEVRIGSSTGALLTRGTMPKGETLTLYGAVLWVHVTSGAANLDLYVNAKLAHAVSSSTLDATVTPAGLRLP